MEKVTGLEILVFSATHRGSLSRSWSQLLTKIWSSIFSFSWIHKILDIKRRHFLNFYKFILQPSVSASPHIFRIRNCFCMPKLFKIWSRDPILKNLSKYHVLLSFFEFWLSILITYFSHLSPLSISTLNHFSPYLSTLSTPLSLILPYLAIFQAIFQSMAGGGHPPHSFTLPSHLPHPHSRYLHFSSLTSVIYISPLSP
jgi:hypothetical protein